MMFAICIEASHQKGLGHLFRMLNFTKFLNEKSANYEIFINNDEKSLSWLKNKNLNFEIVDYSDISTDWESVLIEKYSIKYWVNDRLDTEIEHSKNIVKNGIKLVTFDDNGSGAELADLNICALPCRHYISKGKKILTGIKYLILNSQIANYRRQRTELNKIIVSLGGSDTYGVTVKIAEILKKQDKTATIIIGPAFQHKKELENITQGRFEIKESVPELIKEFYNYDLAITGGGITPFEANASGLPCIIIANELHEIENADFLDNLGTSMFMGYHENINDLAINPDIDILKLSSKGIELFNLNGCENIYSEFLKL